MAEKRNFMIFRALFYLKYISNQDDLARVLLEERKRTKNTFFEGCIKGFFIICQPKTKRKLSLSKLSLLQDYTEKKICKNGDSWELLLFGSNLEYYSTVSFQKKAEL